MSTKSTEMVYPAWLNRNEYPFKSNFINLPVGNMHYVDQGKGDPIVMVHGNPGWSFEFRMLIKELSATNRCIAPDHIGFGLSDKPADWDYLPEHHAQNLEMFLDQLNLKNVTLVFNDWGGPIALSYAIKYPEKVKKIVILNTWLWSVEKESHFRKFSNMMGKGIGKFLIKYFNIFGKMVVKKAVGDKTKLTKEIHRHYYVHLEKPSQRKGCYVFPREIIGSSKWLDGLWQQRARLNSIPVSIVWGMKDIAFREKELLIWMNYFPKAKVTKLEHVGHYPQEEAPDVVIAALKA